ncbi:carbohydrate sulfotransferase 11-like [Styela clava]
MAESRGTYLCYIIAFVALCQTCKLVWITTSTVGNTKEESRTFNAKLELSAEQKSRLKTIERECEKYDEELKLKSRKDAIPHMIVDDERRILFCDIPKVASSNWKRVFIDDLKIKVNGSSNIRDVHAKRLLPDLRYYTPEEQDYRLKNYFKFMFVRHPFERLLSAYRNKLENREIEWIPSTKHSVDYEGNYYHEKEVIMRVKTEGPNNKNTISFSKFVDTLTDPGYRMKHYNTHWKQYHKLCHPCFIRYDFIGKLETLPEDLAVIHNATGLYLEKWLHEKERTTSPTLLNKYYKTLHPDKIAHLLSMYDIDLAMYEYDKF